MYPISPGVSEDLRPDHAALRRDRQPAAHEVLQRAVTYCPHAEILWLMVGFPKGVEQNDQNAAVDDDKHLADVVCLFTKAVFAWFC